MTTDVFTALASESRWLAWREELRGGKPNKTPYSCNGGYAKTDDPATWATRSAAEAAARRLLVGNGRGGIGIVLADLGTDAFLCGLDLDACVEDGIVSDWAAEIVATLDSYCEMSPTGTGLKLFFYAASEDIRPFLNRIGADPGAWGAAEPFQREIRRRIRVFSICSGMRVASGSGRALYRTRAALPGPRFVCQISAHGRAYVSTNPVGKSVKNCFSIWPLTK